MRQYDLLDGFSEFWEAYPNKKSKGRAFDWWKKNKPSKELQLKMHSTLYAQKGSPEWLKNKGEFIPHPASWLNADGWENEVSQAVKPKCHYCKQIKTPLKEVSVSGKTVLFKICESCLRSGRNR